MVPRLINGEMKENFGFKGLVDNSCDGSSTYQQLASCVFFFFFFSFVPFSLFSDPTSR